VFGSICRLTQIGNKKQIKKMKIKNKLEQGVIIFFKKNRKKDEKRC